MIERNLPHPLTKEVSFNHLPWGKPGINSYPTATRVEWAVGFCERAYWWIFRIKRDERLTARRKELRNLINEMTQQMSETLDPLEVVEYQEAIDQLEKDYRSKSTNFPRDFRVGLAERVIARAATVSKISPDFIKRVWVGEQAAPNQQKTVSDKHRVLTLKERNEIRRLLALKYSVQEIASLVGVTRQAVVNIRDLRR